MWTTRLIAPLALLLAVAAPSHAKSQIPKPQPSPKSEPPPGLLPGIPGLEPTPGTPGAIPAPPEPPSAEKIWTAFKVTEGTLECNDEGLWTFSYGAHQALFDTSVRARLLSGFYRGLHDLHPVGVLLASHKQAYYRDFPDLEDWERKMIAAGERGTDTIFRGGTGQCIAVRIKAKTKLYRVEMNSHGYGDVSLWQNVEPPEGKPLRKFQHSEARRYPEWMEVVPGTLEFEDADKRALLFRTAKEPDGIRYPLAAKPRDATQDSGLKEQARREPPDEPVAAFQYEGTLHSKITIPVTGPTPVYRVRIEAEGRTYTLWQHRDVPPAATAESGNSSPTTPAPEPAK